MPKCYLKIFICTLVFILIGICGYYFYAKKQASYPIDLVYAWVDGSDETWLQKKQYWQEKYNINERYSVGETRFRDREELKHSLRSVELYMPWIRNIYIVTDNQIPKWLNLDHPKIKIIDHKDIFPHDALPVFNSIAIESRIALIPGLSEHFIYSNDDCFVNKPVTPDFFFNEKKEPIYYFDSVTNKATIDDIITGKNNLRLQIALNPARAFRKKIDIDFSKIPNSAGIHNMVSLRKSQLLQIMDVFKDELKSTNYSKFRAQTDVMIMALYYYWRFKYQQMDLRDSRKDMEKYGCKNAGILVLNNMEDLETEDPCLFCLNDSITLVDDRHTIYLRNRFPNKSKFEK